MGWAVSRVSPRLLLMPALYEMIAHLPRKAQTREHVDIRLVSAPHDFDPSWADREVRPFHHRSPHVLEKHPLQIHHSVLPHAAIAISHQDARHRGQRPCRTIAILAGTADKIE